MIKHAFKILIPICAISAVCLLFSWLIFDSFRGSHHSGDSVILDAETHTQHESWEIEEPYSRIELDTGMFTVNLIPSNGNATEFEMDSNGNGEVETYMDEFGLHISASSETSFDDFIDRLADALSSGKGWDDLWSVGTLNVKVPYTSLEGLTINVGSGKVNVSDIWADDCTFHIGSGELNFNGTGEECSNMNLYMGSGKCVVNKIACISYDINIGSGKYEVNGLRGSGNLDMGSGSGVLGFDSVDGASGFDIGSGSLTVNIPDDADLVIDADIGAGKVSVNTSDCSTTLRSNKSVTLGSGESVFDIELGSGKVNIVGAGSVPDSTVVATTAVDTQPVEATEIAEVVITNNI